MPIIPKKLIMFDLDGTLAVSKQSLDEEMAGLLRQLLDHYKVAIISGGALPQFEKQVLGPMSASEAQLHNFILMPTTSANIYLYEQGEWRRVFAELLTEDEKKKIFEHLNKAIDEFKLRPEVQYGELIEDRETQVSYSALGQKAPPEEKAVWDPTGARRVEVIAYLKPFLPGFSIRSGGGTTIDITHEGIDKAHGVHQAMNILNINLSDIVFVGDALYPGGNDEAAKLTGVDCVEVKTVEDTKNYIRSIL
jgi:HAD superfamily hydrolase (TIGR01484 family)